MIIDHHGSNVPWPRFRRDAKLREEPRRAAKEFKGTVLFPALAAFFLFPALAHANAGTPLMWLTIMHLTVGNLVIGIFEGLLIACAFKIRVWKPIGWMIAANYFSAFCGYVFLGTFSHWFANPLLRPNTLSGILPYIQRVGLVLILATYLLEWPFCLLIFRKDLRRWRKSGLATLLAQTSSYAILVPLYLSATAPSVLTKTKLEQGLGFAKDPQATVYFLDEHGEVWRKRLNDQPAERVTDAKAKGEADRLYARPDETGKRWDLWLVRANTKNNQNTHELLLENFSPRAGRSGFVLRKIRNNESLNPYPEPNTWRNFSYDEDAVTDLRPEKERDWRCQVSVWAMSGLVIDNEKTRQRYGFGLETPILSLHTSNVTVLPGDQAIYQLGADMIVLLDLNTRQLALIAWGHGPAVGLED